jgi:hypothetical protein
MASGPAEVESLRKFLDDSTLDRRLNLALALELEEGLRWILDAGGAGPFEKPLPARTVWVPFRNLDAIYFLRTCRSGIEEARRPYPEAKKALEALRAGKPPGYAPYSNMILPDFAQAAHLTALEKARLQMLRLALDSAKPDPAPLPVNPFTGAAWKLATEASGVWLDGGHSDLKLKIR